MMRKTLSQLTCWYQFDRVIGISVMWVFLGSYLGFRLGSVGFDMAEGCVDEYSGLTARSPEVGCEEGISTDDSQVC